MPLPQRALLWALHPAPLNIRSPSLNSLHITHHYPWCVCTICLPHCNVSSKAVRTPLLSHSVLHPQWLEHCSSKELVNTKSHTCTSDKNGGTGNAFLQRLPERGRLPTLEFVVNGIHTESRLCAILGNTTMEIRKLVPWVEWKLKHRFNFWFLCFWQNTNTFYQVMLNLSKNVKGA